MKIIEFRHEEDYPGKTNLDLWVEAHPGFTSKKWNISKTIDYPEYQSFDLLILHGGAQHLWDKKTDPWLGQEVTFVREALKRRKPVIGFCLGSQLIAEALSGEVFPAVKKEAGWFKILPVPGASGHVLMKGLEEGFVTYLWHSDHYNLPLNCRSLAYTTAAENQLYFSNQAPVVGMQFHPEYTKDLIEYYIKNCYEELIEGTDYPGSVDSLLEELQGKPDTYGLFKKLMDNSLDWLKQEFGFTGD